MVPFLPWTQMALEPARCRARLAGRQKPQRAPSKGISRPPGGARELSVLTVSALGGGLLKSRFYDYEKCTRYSVYLLSPDWPCSCLASSLRELLAEEPSAVTAAEALHRLEEGNARFVSGLLSSTTPAALAASREKVAQGQKPFAVIVGCSDSRVGPEVIFDQKLGDIFVIRTAGEVVDDVALGSIEYAVEHLGAPLIVVLGHQRCGAVDAAVAGSA